MDGCVIVCIDEDDANDDDDNDDEANDMDSQARWILEKEEDAQGRVQKSHGIQGCEMWDVKCKRCSFSRPPSTLRTIDLWFLGFVHLVGGVKYVKMYGDIIIVISLVDSQKSINHFSLSPNTHCSIQDSPILWPFPVEG